MPSEPLLADPGRVLDALDDLAGLAEEGRVRADALEGGRVGAQGLGHGLLDAQRQRLVGLAEEVEAGDLVPRLVQHLVGEDAGRVVLERRNSLLLPFAVDVVVEDLLRGLSVAVVALEDG